MSASWIAKLNESDSRLHKEDVIKQALEAATLGSSNAINFLYFTKACYNPYITYGVKQVPNTKNITNAENPWDEFKELLNDLHQRNITGNMARDCIQTMAERFNSDEWNNFLAPVLRRDLRAGISDKTINKICKKTEYEVPVFGCQLATNSENRPEMSGVKRLEPKLDGVRVLMMVEPLGDNMVSIGCFSRNGKLFENFTHIEHQITNSYKKLLDKMLKHPGFQKLYSYGSAAGFVLDGEVIGNTFQELMRQARRKENVEASDSVFNIFDIIPIGHFRKGGFPLSLKERMAVLESVRDIIDTLPNVELLPHKQVDLDTKVGQKEFQKYAKDSVNAGFEGIMIKDLDAPYECKRNTYWMKWKPTITVDLEVIDIEEGTGRNVGRLGALVCSGTDDGKHITVNVGSGFSDDDRTEFWNNRNMVIGRTVEILCDVITQNQDGSYSLRFPRFLRFRDDKE